MQRRARDRRGAEANPWRVLLRLTRAQDTILDRELELLDSADLRGDTLLRPARSLRGRAVSAATGFSRGIRPFVAGVAVMSTNLGNRDPPTGAGPQGVIEAGPQIPVRPDRVQLREATTGAGDPRTRLADDAVIVDVDPEVRGDALREQNEGEQLCPRDGLNQARQWRGPLSPHNAAILLPLKPHDTRACHSPARLVSGVGGTVRVEVVVAVLSFNARAG